MVGANPKVYGMTKGLVGGVYMGEVVSSRDEAAQALTPGNHGTTFGGNPMAGAAGLATIHVIERDGLLANVQERGEQLRTAILGLDDDRIVGVRGAGLLIGIELTSDLAGKVVTAALEAGFIVNAAAPNVVRLAPPLILTAAQAGEFVTALPAVLTQAEETE